MSQIELHKQIDKLLVEQPTDEVSKQIHDLISANEDSRQYFYWKADENWLNWLWKNGFLDVIKEKPSDSTQYRMPELYYLERIAEKVPAKVVDIILTVPISGDTFNPVVIDRFLWICKILHAEQLARMMGKIRDEKWGPLMGPANRWFGYEKMFKTLIEAKDYRSVLILAEAVLAVRTKDEINRDTPGIRQDNPFYFNDLIETKVFESLTKISDEYIPQALTLITRILHQIVLLGEKGDTQECFPQRDIFHFYETNFFTLKLGQRTGAFGRDDIIEFMATVKTLIERLVSKKSIDSDVIQRLYMEYIDPLPQSMVMWRFRLFVLSLSPGAFPEKLKESFFKLFTTEHYFEITSGAEYKLALQKSFHILAESGRRDYVANVIRYFTEQSAKEKDAKQWIKNTGAQILTMIWPQLTPEEQQKAKDAEMTLIPNYEPEPSIGEVSGGFVSPQGPTSQEEFHNLPVSEIAIKLQTEWAPDKLRKQETPENFLTPRNAEGVAESIKADITSRLQEYIDNAERFFSRDTLSSHYTYAYLNGIREVLRENKTDTTRINWQNLITLLSSLRLSGEKKAFEEKKQDQPSYYSLVKWDSVHTAIADVIQELLVEKNGVARIDFSKYRADFLAVLAYLLNYPDPIPADEEVETAKIKTQTAGGDYQASDPLTTAINSVRGRGFEAFVRFVYQDGKSLDKNAPAKINIDVKALYEAVLRKENTRAIMYMFGHYIPSFYFRDKDWIRGLLPVIFPAEDSKKHLYLAAWEGYLAVTLYTHIFNDPAFQDLYIRGVAIDEEKDPGRRYHKDPDEGIAGHLAIAFVNFDYFNVNHKLSKAFWQSGNVKQQAAFISFIGRVYVSTENAKNKEIFQKPEVKQKVMNLWDWVLANCKKTEVFLGFGFWVNDKKSDFEISWLAARVKKTLEITNGVIEWDHGLTMFLPQLATAAPVDALAIARLLLMKGVVKTRERLISFYWDDKCFETLKILYANPATKDGAYTLIDDLIREGGSIFWKLKDILSESDTRSQAP